MFQPSLPPKHYAFHRLVWGQTVLCVGEDVAASENIPTDFCPSIYVPALVIMDWRQKARLWRPGTSARPHGLTCTKIIYLHRLPRENIRSNSQKFLPGNELRQLSGKSVTAIGDSCSLSVLLTEMWNTQLTGNFLIFRKANRDRSNKLNWSAGIYFTQKV